MRPKAIINFVRICALCAMASGVAACGFVPLYSNTENGPGLQANLSAIDIFVGKAKLQQRVYSALIDELTPLGRPAAPKWRLEVALQQIKKGVGFEEDDAVTRFNFQLIGTYALIDTRTGKSVFTSSSRSIAAYNVVANQFATLTAEKDAEKRAARDLARDIRLQLSLHFRQF